MKMPDDIRLVTPDLPLLHRLIPVARHIFTDTFAKHYDEAEFEKFCDGVYQPKGLMARDFEAPDVHWQVAVLDREPIGYAKLTPLRAPATNAAAGSMELQQIYVLSAWHGTGIADRLMEWSVTTAGAHGAPELYLTVFDHNHRAKRFYARHGFVEVGRCIFRLGDRYDDDRIWCRQLR